MTHIDHLLMNMIGMIDPDTREYCGSEIALNMLRDKTGQDFGHDLIAWIHWLEKQDSPRFLSQIAQDKEHQARFIKRVEAIKLLENNEDVSNSTKPKERKARQIAIASVISFLVGFAACFLLNQQSSQAFAQARTLTRRSLSQVGRLFDSWLESYGRYPNPDHWQDEVRKKRGTDSREDKFLDSWGHSLQYKLIKRKNCEAYLLYSLGPDGKDSQGMHDDIVYPIGGYSSE